MSVRNRTRRDTADLALLTAKEHLLDLGHEEELINQFLKGREEKGETGATRATKTFGTPDWNGDGHEIFSDAKARKLCSSNKKNLAQT